MDFRQIATKEASALVSSVADRLAGLAAAEIERHTHRIQKEADTALTAVEAKRDELSTALELARDRIAALEAAFDESDRARQQGIAELANAAAAADELRRSLEAAHQEHNRALAESAALLADGAARFQALEQSLAESEALRVEQARAARDQLVVAARLPLDRLRAAFARLNTVTSVPSALEIMADALGTEFGRVALFKVAGNRLQGVHKSGFDDASDVSKLVVPLNVDSMLTDAVRSKRVRGLTGQELEASRKMFGGAPSFAIAVPIEVRGAVIAVIYADDSDHAQAEGASDRRVKFTEILLWHAVPLMARLAAEEEELAEYRKYAVGLLRDLESVYTTESGSGYAERELRVRLRHNLDYARRMYAQSIEAEDRSAAGLLDQEIAALVDARRDTAFGRDLAEVAGLDVPIEETPQKAQTSAQKVKSR